MMAIRVTAFAETSEEYSYSNGISLGEMSREFMGGPLGGIASAAFSICYVIGAGLLMTALIRYRQHRQNPNRIRLSEVSYCLIFGFSLILLPWLVQHFSTGAQILRAYSNSG